MFQIGDKVLYPMHGAGTIEAIEEKEILGERRRYYVISIPISNMNVMIPIGSVETAGVRPVADSKTMKSIIFDFHNEEPTCGLPWKERYKQNMEKLKTGGTLDGAEVVRDLLHLQKEKPLNSSEKQMLNDASKILISELSIIKDISETQAADLLVI
ncbi:transcription factor YdeB [Bacillus sp. FJAT-49711]|uniref:CarD family transcriptional regulator n=1 Tax=Bacillus sp. FJAT-49711 TaxID=2833585 RepID=UPI001BC916CF|nr:CarD family transcriptional regulator [Bacillus sp. FJAT-49711]MBS4220802.1 transcription factor YdeB [Bacillus sp. FJAT-49711]